MSGSHTPVGLYFTKELETGGGLFDALMVSIETKLENQFKHQRLRGPDYAQVYAQSIASTLNNTTQYLLGTLFLDEQREEYAKKNELIDKEIEKTDKELEKIDAEIEVLKLQPILTNAQIEKINAEIDFLEAQKAMMDSQKEKIDAEIEFIGWKVETEKANTVSSAADPESLIGKQKQLLAAQKLGFAGDLLAKIAKMHGDYQGIFQSIQEIPEASSVTNNGPTNSAFSNVENVADQIKVAN